MEKKRPKKKTKKEEEKCLLDVKERNPAISAQLVSVCGLRYNTTRNIHNGNIRKVIYPLQRCRHLSFFLSPYIINFRNSYVINFNVV